MDKRLELDIYIKKETTLTPQQNLNVLRIRQAFCALSSLHAAQLCFSYFPLGGLFPWLPVLASNSWHLGTGWKHCSVFLSFLQEQQKHNWTGLLVSNSSRWWYHWTELGDFALFAPFPSRCRSRWSLYSCWPLPCQRSANRRWGLGLVSLPSCTEDSQATFSCSSHRYFLLATRSSSASWGTACTASLMLTGGQVTADTANAWQL